MIIMRQQAKNTEATHKFTGLHKPGRHGGEVIIGDRVLIAVLVVGSLSLSLAA
jgi:hypothetical protein